MLVKPDDCTLTASQRLKVRAEAERALREAGALGVLPTPVERILAVAKVEEVKDNVLDEGFPARMRAAAGGAIKSAISKVLGLFQAKSGLIFIQHTLLKVRKTFIRLHEAAHGFMPWQRGMYALVEDCEHALDSDIAALFDREAEYSHQKCCFSLIGSFRTPKRASSAFGRPCG